MRARLRYTNHNGKMNTMNQDQALMLADDRGAIVPRDLDEVARLSKVVVASRLAPDSVKTPEAAAVIIMTGAELGLTPMKALRTIHVVKGRPTLSADLMVALVKASGACQSWRVEECTPERCAITTTRTGESKPERLVWTMDDARRAQLGGDNWKKYPRAMLRARCSSELARMVYPDVVGGLYDPDELGGAPIRAEPVQVVSDERADRLDEKEMQADAGDAVDAEVVESQDDTPYIEQLQEMDGARNAIKQRAPGMLPLWDACRFAMEQERSCYPSVVASLRKVYAAFASGRDIDRITEGDIMRGPIGTLDMARGDDYRGISEAHERVRANALWRVLCSAVSPSQRTAVTEWLASASPDEHAAVVDDVLSVEPPDRAERFVHLVTSSDETPTADSDDAPPYDDSDIPF